MQNQKNPKATPTKSTDKNPPSKNMDTKKNADTTKPKNKPSTQDDDADDMQYQKGNSKSNNWGNDSDADDIRHQKSSNKPNTWEDELDDEETRDSRVRR